MEVKKPKNSYVTLIMKDPTMMWSYLLRIYSNYCSSHIVATLGNADPSFRGMAGKSSAETP
jgi:hypothetical protein